MIGFGIDVSHHQSPDALPWESWRGIVDFVLVRAAYGRTPDAQAARHVARARSIGAQVGLWSFFRIVEPVDAQLATLQDVSKLCGIVDGDIVPQLDIENDEGRKPEPSWSAPCEEFSGKVADAFGNAMIYVTQADWHAIGAPAWMLRRPIWAAHWTNAATPATPGNMPATIWQWRVGAFDPKGPGGLFAGDPQLDHDRLLQPLPLIGQVVTDFERDRIEGLIALSLSETVHPEWPAPPKDIA